MHLNDTAPVVSLDCVEHLVAALLLNYSGNITINPFYCVEWNCLTAMIDILLQLFSQSVTLLVSHLLLLLTVCARLTILFGCLLCCRCLSWSFGSLLSGFRSLSLFTGCEYGLDSLLVFVTCCCHEGVQLLGCHLSKFLCCHNTVNFKLLLKCYFVIFDMQIYKLFSS